MKPDASTVNSARLDFVGGAALSEWKSPVRSGMSLGYSGLHMLEKCQGHFAESTVEAFVPFSIFDLYRMLGLFVP